MPKSDKINDEILQKKEEIKKRYDLLRNLSSDKRFDVLRNLLETKVTELDAEYHEIDLTNAQSWGRAIVLQTSIKCFNDVLDIENVYRNALDKLNKDVK